jgi:hypothetical protein
MRFSLRQLFVLIGCGGLGLLLLVSIQSLRKDAISLNEAGQITQCALALRMYHDANGAFPPAVFVDPAGVPHMSWRVAVLPYMEQQALFATYKTGQPWNSLANSAACDVCIRSYAAPELEGSRFTNIVMPTGPGAIGEEGVSIHDFTDSLGDTILVLALKPSEIPWHEPRDLPIGEITRAPNNPQRILIRDKLFTGAWCATVAGRAQWLPPDLDYDTFHAMLTISGGERVDWSWQK